MSTPLPKPTNWLVEILNGILDRLIMGLGVEAAIAYATAELPWLAWPVIRPIFRKLVEWLASYIDTFAKRNIDILVIRFQNDARKKDYDQAIEELKKPDATPEEIKRAKDALDRLINRNK